MKTFSRFYVVLFLRVESVSVSVKSLTGLDPSGFAGSCPDIIEYTRKPDQTTNINILYMCRLSISYHVQVCILCVHIWEQRTRLKGREATKNKKRKTAGS